LKNRRHPDNRVEYGIASPNIAKVTLIDFILIITAIFKMIKENV
jgi:hypothetical protein